jgi:HD-GYP domain-containing protein (c-di-GMP phosphodiesterase class II)
MDPKDAIEELYCYSGSQFDLELIRVFIQEVLSINTE